MSDKARNIAMVINLVLDESGSMASQRQTTIDAVNKYIEEQKEKSREKDQGAYQETKSADQKTSGCQVEIEKSPSQ